jgi:hypothetical protein
LKIDSQYFNDELDGLPHTIEMLDLSNTRFNRSIDNIPGTLEYLYLSGTPFNQPIGKLPNMLSVLRLGSSFNQPLERNVFPSGFKVISFGRAFNQDLNNVLPDNMETIHFVPESEFNQRVYAFPRNLRNLYFGDAFNQNIDDIPSALTYLHLGRGFNYSIQNAPRNIVRIATHSLRAINLKEIPRGVRYFMHFGGLTTGDTHDLPPQLIGIMIEYNYSIRIDSFPATITEFINKGSQKIPDEYVKRFPFIRNA